jgi:hypothetical protein
MDVEVNYLAVFLAAVSTMVVGSIWYAKPVFGSEWQRLVKLSDDQLKKGSVMAMTMAFIAALITAYVLAHVSYLANQFFGNSFMQDAVSTAFWLWLGISATTIVTHNAFEQRRKKLTALALGNQLVTFLVMGVIIGWLVP